MTRTWLAAVCAAVMLACGSVVPAMAQAGQAPVATVDEGTQKKIDSKVNKLLGAAKVEDAEKAAKAKTIVGEWLVTMGGWHAEHDKELNTLWKEWGQARSVVPKDEFPGEVVAHKIDAVYASLKPAYEAFIIKLSAVLSPEQLDAFKEAWSRSPGMKRTYNAYVEAVPDLTDEQKKVIADRMNQAREDAMLTDADKEIVNIYKRHKVKVEEYIGSLEWAKLHKALAEKGKAPATQAK